MFHRNLLVFVKRSRLQANRQTAAIELVKQHVGTVHLGLGPVMMVVSL